MNINMTFDDGSSESVDGFLDIYPAIKKHYSEDSVPTKHSVLFDISAGDVSYRAKYKGYIEFNSWLAWFVLEVQGKQFVESKMNIRSISFSIVSPDVGTVVWSRFSKANGKTSYVRKSFNSLTPSSKERLFRVMFLSNWDIFAVSPIGGYFGFSYNDAITLAHYLFGIALSDTKRNKNSIFDGYHWQLDAINVLIKLLQKMDRGEINTVSSNSAWVRLLVDACVQTTNSSYAGMMQKSAITCLTLLDPINVKSVLADVEIILMKQIKTVFSIKSALVKAGDDNG